MNLMYYRKSKIVHTRLVKNIYEQAQKQGVEIKAEIKIKNGIYLFATKTAWIEKLLEIDKQLIAMTPGAIIVLQENEGTTIGITKAEVLAIIHPNQDIKELSAEIENTLTQLIHKAGELSERKLKKVKLYATTTCPYCKMEEAWLKEKKIEYEISLLDWNQKEAQYMVEKTGQMGVPVTEILYEDADSEWVIGFNKEQLNKMIGT